MIKLWELMTGSLLKTLGHQSYVNSVAFSLDGNMILSSSSDLMIIL